MKDRSIFWPLAMIAAGVLWLLIGLDIIPRTNLWALTHTLPYLLIALGLGLILRAYWRFAGMLVSLAVIVGAVAAVVYAPQLGWDDAPGWGLDIWDFDPEIGGAVAGSGVVKTETRRVSDFDSIVLEYPGEITVRQGESESVKIEAEDNLLAQLSTEVRNGTLYLENTERNWRDRVNPTEPVLVTITVVELNRVQFPTAGKMLIEELKTDSLSVSVSGAGDVTLKDLDAGSLDFSLSGAGNINVDGIAESLQLSISGFGNFNGGDLQSQSADVHISGAGSARVWAEESLSASISGAGSVDYYGDPTVDEHISGVGSVRSLGNK
ncbi:MAG: head GIN domain-containing protein, partial [Anaerolineales bacterium]